MITPNIDMRYTSEQALHAFEDLSGEVTAEQTEFRLPHAPPTCSPFHRPFCPWQVYDRWAGLPKNFVAECAKQMAPVQATCKSSRECDSWELDTLV